MSTLHVCFLWHMHQPSYVDPTQGETTMPWMRLHGVKDYTDMAALLDLVDDARVTFNFVPGLLDQLERAATADPLQDRFLRLTLTPPEELDAHGRAFVTRWFFSLHQPTLLEPHPRYRELRAAAQSGEPLSDAELRDLQVFFNLAWCGATVRARPAVAGLLRRGRDFTEADKANFLAAHHAALGEVVGRYRALAAAGRVELTCTPHDHPILPLLLDSDLARMADPSTPLPVTRFRWPSDARAHLRRAVEAHTARFGAAPRGLWPAEGAVAQAILPLVREAGIAWIATDETILRKSLDREELTAHDLYAPWLVDGVSVFFRDQRRRGAVAADRHDAAGGDGPGRATPAPAPRRRPAAPSAHAVAASGGVSRSRGRRRRGARGAGALGGAGRHSGGGGGAVPRGAPGRRRQADRVLPVRRLERARADRSAHLRSESMDVKRTGAAGMRRPRQ